ncbi:MAG: glycosyltransferase family 4 protein [Candidatus Aenigmatarchaeota archaeon]
MKVFLFMGMHPMYETLVKYPPSGIEYITNIEEKSFDNLKIYKDENYMKKKNLLNKVLNLLRIPRIYYSFNKYELIHSTRGFLILNKTPWVVDIEHVASFTGMQHKSLYNSKYLIFKILNRKYCKKIIPHSIAAKKSFISVFGRKLNDKLSVVYPAIYPLKFKRRKNEKVRLLFIGKNFKEKGGEEVLRAFQILKKMYDVELFIKSDVPKALINKFSDKGIIFVDKIVSRGELFKNYYFSSDIFVFPTYIDTFGYVLLEAMAAGMPIVATDIFAIPEIVEDGKNGLLINSPIRWHDENYLFNLKWGSKKDKEFIVKQLVEKLSLLIEDSSLRRRMGRYSRRLVERGRFSIKERNEKLRKIYEEAIR